MKQYSDMCNFSSYLDFKEHSIGISDPLGPNVIIEYKGLQFVFDGDNENFIGLFENNERIF
jgi:hypothetical protein